MNPDPLETEPTEALKLGKETSEAASKAAAGLEELSRAGVSVHIHGSRLMSAETLDALARMAACVWEAYAAGWRPGKKHTTGIDDVQYVDGRTRFMPWCRGCSWIGKSHDTAADARTEGEAHEHSE